MSKQIFVPIGKLSGDGTQSRESMNPQTVQDYAEWLSDGNELPPITVFHDGSNYWIADGFHRVAAALRVGRQHVLAVVIDGDRRQAKLHSAGSNAAHGLPRTPGDKRKSVWLVLNDEDGKTWSDERIAAHCHVRLSLVRSLRLSTHWSPPPGLFGPDDLAVPPPPDFAGREKANADDDDAGDMEAIRGKAVRAARKFIRFAQELNLTDEEWVKFLQDVATEMAGKAT